MRHRWYSGLSLTVAQPRAQEAIRRLIHRGPDRKGWNEREQAVLGMRRLAIIDLTTGDQPIYNEDRTIAVICNGELCDYVERLANLAKRDHRFQSASDVNVIPPLLGGSGAQRRSRSGLEGSACSDSGMRSPAHGAESCSIGLVRYSEGDHCTRPSSVQGFDQNLSPWLDEGGTEITQVPRTPVTRYPLSLAASNGAIAPFPANTVWIIVVAPR